LRKLITSSLAATLLLGLLVVPTVALGPKCADFQSTNAAGTQTSRAAFDGTTGEVAGQFFLRGRSCDGITYTLFIADNDGDAAFAQASVTGDGVNPWVVISVSGVTATDGDVCAWVTSSRGKKVIDRAPADGCVVLLDDGSSPGGGKGF
jgi:hypothetical protein